MSEIVRGKVQATLDQYIEIVHDSELPIRLGTEVLILPIEDGKMGDFEPWMIGWLKYRWLVKELEEWCDTFEGQLPNGFWFMSNEEVDQQLSAAISRLFEEVESEG